MHTLNNLLGYERFTPRELDAIADALDHHQPMFPTHRTPFLGNYDVNVLESALIIAGYDLRWHDSRDTELGALDTACQGYIVNVRSYGIFSKLLGPGRHWFAIKNIDDVYYNLDSKLHQPQILGDKEAMKSFLVELLHDDSTSQFFSVCKSTQ